MHSRALKLFAAWLTLTLMGLVACDRSSGGNGKSVRAVTGGEQGWEIVNPHSSGWPVGPVTVGDKGMVCVSPYGARFSADGKTWLDVELPPSRNKRGIDEIVFGANRYVMVRGTEILASNDGTAWEIRWTGTKYFFTAAYGNGVFVVGGPQGALMTSKDGMAWNESKEDTSRYFTSIEFGNGTFVAVNPEKDEIWNSPDAVAWTKVQDIEVPARDEEEQDGDNPAEESEAAQSPANVVFGNGRFLVVGRQFYQSKDGRTWQADGASLGEKVHFANGRFIAFERNGDNGPVGVATSQDLVDWDRQETDLEFKPEWIAYMNGRYVTANDPGHEGFVAICSPQLSQWSPANMVTVQTLHDVAFGAGKFVAVGDSGTVLTSPDGFAWTAEKKPVADNLEAVAYGTGTFVAVGFRSKPLFSRDGKSWETAESAPVAGLSSIAFGNGMFVAVESRGTAVLISENGKAWSEFAVDLISRPKVVSGNGVFLLVGEDKVYQSTDAKKWRRSWPGRTGESGLGFDGRRFVFQGVGSPSSGYSKIVSADGLNWNETRSLPEARRDKVPAVKGEAILASPHLYWQTPDSLFEIKKPEFPVNAIEYGNGVFVSVGYNGAIGVMKIPYRPVADDRAAQPVASRKIGPFSNRFFLGQVDDRYLVYMRLTHTGESLGGDYRYLRQKTPLKLQGRMDEEGEFSLQESPAPGKTTGNIAGRLYGGFIHGEWTNPEGTKRLGLTGMETTDRQMSEMTKRFADLYAKRVGTYAVASLGDLVGANTLYDCTREDTGWSCGGSSIVGGRREPFEDGFDPDFNLKMVSSIRVEIKKDLTVEVFVKGKSRWILPVNENRLAFFREPNSIAKGIKIRELAVPEGREDGVFDLKESENTLTLDGHPQLYLKKIR